MQSIVVIVHVIVAVAIVGLVLLQQGKGADAGASFGAGASQTVFGSSGSGNFLVRATTVLATIFFVTSLTLAIYARNQSGFNSTDGLPVVNDSLIQQQVPALDELPQADLAPADSQDDLPSLPGDDN
ncbi:MAG: preprotein translocase subunit SecG [Gammaproteobacteria bacterium]